MNGNKTLFDRQKKKGNFGKGIIKNILKNMEENNGVYIPLPHLINQVKEKKEIKPQKPKMDLKEFDFDPKDVEYIINKCLNYNFKQT